jgi:hypothetical protein
MLFIAIGATVGGHRQPASLYAGQDAFDKRVGLVDGHRSHAERAVHYGQEIGGREVVQQARLRDTAQRLP